MKHEVDVAHDLIQQLPVADVAFDESNRSARHGARDVVDPTPHKVVDHHDLTQLPAHQKVNDRGADQAGSPCNQHPATVQTH